MPTTAQLIAALYSEATVRPETIADLKTILNSLNAGLIANNVLNITNAADYSNATNAYSDIVTGSITTSAGTSLLVEASGFLLLTQTQSNATIQSLSEDAVQGQIQLHIDGVAKDHATVRIVTGAALVSGAWEFIGGSDGHIFLLVTGLAAGAHTVAVKGKLLVVPASGATLLCNASSTPSVFGYNLRAVEI